MCGIVGVVGNTNATEILIQGLEKLEYRGYDSAGIFVIDEGKKGHLVKSVGRISDYKLKLIVKLLVRLGLAIHVGLLTGRQQKQMLTHILQQMVVLFWYIME